MGREGKKGKGGGGVCVIGSCICVLYHDIHAAGNGVCACQYGFRQRYVMGTVVCI